MNKWISVKDRLPGDARDVLCCDCIGDMAVMYKNNYGWQGSNILDGPYDVDVIPLFWQELPKRPEE